MFRKQWTRLMNRHAIQATHALNKRALLTEEARIHDGDLILTADSLRHRN